MEIKNYEVMINEKNSTCGVIINIDEYNIDMLKDKILYYDVDVPNKKIDILSENNDLLVSLLNIDDGLRYYAFKSVEIVIIGGTLIPEAKFVFVLSAKLK